MTPKIDALSQQISDLTKGEPTGPLKDIIEREILAARKEPPFNRRPEPAAHRLHVYSVNCAWNGPIHASKIIPRSPGIPGCPFCTSVLMQVEEGKWLEAAKSHEALGNTNYVEFIQWVADQPTCYPDFKRAALSFMHKTGKTVVWNIKPS